MIQTMGFGTVKYPRKKKGKIVRYHTFSIVPYWISFGLLILLLLGFGIYELFR